MALDKKQLAVYSEFIFKELGIFYSEANYYQLEPRLKEAAKMLGYEDAIDMLSKTDLATNAKLRNIILDLSTNNETLFFRDREIFDGIAKNVLDPYMQNLSPVLPFKIWSAACSTGQEVYSLIFTLEKYKKSNPTFSYNVLASDYSTRVLDYAKEAKYRRLETQRGLLASELNSYFEKGSDDNGEYWSVLPKYKKKADFKQINLRKKWPLSTTYNAILCRNVLIYQLKEEKEKILKRLHEKLSPGGVLILGCAESIIGMSEYFEQKMDGVSVYYIKKELTKKLGAA